MWNLPFQVKHDIIPLFRYYYTKNERVLTEIRKKMSEF